MSDLTPLNDPELQQLEHSLQSLKLKPAASQQEQYLYQCGRAAGRAELKKQLWISSTFMGMFAISTFCLCLTVWNQPLQNNSPDEPVAVKPFHTNPEFTETVLQPGILRLSSDLAELTSTNKQNKHRPHTNFPPVQSPHIFTPRSWPELLDN